MSSEHRVEVPPVADAPEGSSSADWGYSIERNVTPENARVQRELDDKWETDPVPEAFLESLFAKSA